MKHKSNNFKVGGAIFDMINPIVPTYPIVADKDANFPFAVYRKASFVPSYTKDRNDYQDTTNYEITILTRTYKEGTELAEKVNDKLELARGKWKDLLIRNIWLINSIEDYDGENYLQKLIYQIDIDTTN